MTEKKILIIVMDGLGDRACEELRGLTPLQYVRTPNLDWFVNHGSAGLCDPIAPGIRAGSDTAHLAILGYDPYKVYTGRGPFEAIGVGMDVQPGDVALRCNFATVDDDLEIIDRRAGRIKAPETTELVEALDGILADLGVSSHHFDEGERGFSFRYDAALDMRMNQTARLTAAEVVNTYSEEQLADIFYLYGEMKNSRKLAATIIKARKEKEIGTTGQLAELLRPLLGREREKKDMAKVFQALRIEVNGEMKALRQMLNGAIDMLKPGGRLVVLTYHSLEDRMVKNIMRSGNIEGKTEQDFFGNIIAPLKPIKKGVAVPSEAEQQENPRSRSAKLRIAEMK